MREIRATDETMIKTVSTPSIEFPIKDMRIPPIPNPKMLE